MNRPILLFFVFFSLNNIWAQNSCMVNLWSNGNFEKPSNSCLKVNPLNNVNNPPPFNGNTVFRWRANKSVQPQYLEEVKTDKTLGTQLGHYLYVDPRNKSGWDYEFYQSIQVEENTTYTFSMWYCSMNKPNLTPAPVRLKINNDILTVLTISNTPNVWKEIKVTWNSGNSTTAIARFETFSSTIMGYDFAIDDIYFGKGKLLSDAGRDTTICEGEQVRLGGNIPGNLGVICNTGYVYEWQPSNYIAGNNKTGNPLSLPLNNKLQFYLKIIDNDSNICIDTVQVDIKYKQKKLLDVFRDTQVCLPINYQLALNPKYKIIKWDDGSKLYTRSLRDTGLYWINFEAQCVEYSDSMRLKVHKVLDKVTINDTIVCAQNGALYNLKSYNPMANFTWGDTGKFKIRLFTKAGLYSFKFSDQCKTVSDTFEIKFFDENFEVLPNKMNICLNTSKSIRIPYAYQSIVWSDGDTSHIKWFKSKGKYSVRNNLCSLKTDSIEVDYFVITPIYIGQDDSICYSERFAINGPSANNYLWSTGETTQNIAVNKPGKYALTIEDSNKCLVSDTIQLLQKKGDFTLWIPNAFTPNDDGMNDRFPENEMKFGVEISIYSRWGELIWHTEGYDTWDGKLSNGEICSDNLLMYYIKYRDCQKIMRVKTGTFYILK
jgi:gliding motility-associated-like protein